MRIGETGFLICGAHDATELAAIVAKEGIASCLYLSTFTLLSMHKHGCIYYKQHLVEPFTRFTFKSTA